MCSSDALSSTNAGDAKNKRSRSSKRGKSGSPKNRLARQRSKGRKEAKKKKSRTRSSSRGTSGDEEKEKIPKGMCSGSMLELMGSFVEF